MELHHQILEVQNSLMLSLTRTKRSFVNGTRKVNQLKTKSGIWDLEIFGAWRWNTGPDPRVEVVATPFPQWRTRYWT